MGSQNGFSDLYSSRKKQYDDFTKKVILPDLKKSFHPLLYKSVNYTLNAGGKRFRPVICISAFHAGKKPTASADILNIAAALEFIHTYSLIHDDLPSMDNDDFRRGKPTCHKVFSESTAILTGDALNSCAFFLLAKVRDNSPGIINDLLEILHKGAGGPGMVSGQIEDIENEKSHKKSATVLKRIHKLKTGALIQAAMLAGNRLRSDYKKRIDPVTSYSEKLGLLFQITDDILDIEGTIHDLGKTPGKDAANDKLTFPSVYGLDKSKKMAVSLKNEMIEISRILEPDHEIFFKTLPEYIANRKN